MQYPPCMVKRGRFSALLVLVASVHLHAHHSLPAEYDVKNPIVLRGRIVRVEWVNPHTFVYLEVKADGRKVDTWQVEGGAPSTLIRANLPREKLIIGSEVVISGWPAYNSKLKAAGKEITFSDGTMREMASRPDPTPLQAPKPVEYSLDFGELAWNVLPYAGAGMPVVVLLIGLYVWRRQEVRK
jgi:hypothetical protein